MNSALSFSPNLALASTANQIGLQVQGTRLPRCMTLIALIFATIAALAAITIQDTYTAYAAQPTTKGDALAKAAEKEYQLMETARQNKNDIRYGMKYCRWAYDVKGESPKKEDWCAYFVSYCAQESKLFDARIYPRDWGTFASVPKTRSWLMQNGCPAWQNDGTYVPRRLTSQSNCNTF